MTATTVKTAGPQTEATDVRGRVIDLACRYAATTTLIIVLLCTIGVAPSFYSASNFRPLLLQVSALGVVVIGQTLVLLLRGLDMSVSAVVLVTAVFVVRAASGGQLLGYLLAAVVIALLVGLINGGLIVYRSVPPFIATFSMLIVVGGAELAYTSGQSSGSVPHWARVLGAGRVGGVPYATIIWLVMLAALAAALTLTTWGRWVYAVGNSPAGARHAGVPVSLVVLSAYVICALCALIGGLLLSGYLGYVDQTVGNSVGLNSITATILGGVAFSGGRGGPIGSAIGAVLMTVLVNVVVVAGLAVYWQYVVVGIALVLAVTIQGLRDRWLPDSA